jgi:hypothetical protein
VKKADPVPNFERALNVLGSEKIQQMIVAITAKTMVHSLWLVIVLRYLALVRTCRPCVSLVNQGRDIAEGSTNLDEGVVQDEHDGRGIPRPLLAPEEHLADITHVPDLRVAEAEFPAMLLAVCPF